MLITPDPSGSQYSAVSTSYSSDLVLPLDENHNEGASENLCNSLTTQEGSRNTSKLSVEIYPDIEKKRLYPPKFSVEVRTDYEKRRLYDISGDDKAITERPHKLSRVLKKNFDKNVSSEIPLSEECAESAGTVVNNGNTSFSECLKILRINDDEDGDDVDKTVEADLDEISDTVSEHPELPLTGPRYAIEKVRILGLIYPKSSYFGFTPPAEISDEVKVLDMFMKNKPNGESEFVEFTLSDFTIYRPKDERRLSLEMVLLSALCVKKGESTLLFDGILSDGQCSRYVKGVPFQMLSVGSYFESDLPEDDDADVVWVQSNYIEETCNGWYKLAGPSKEYSFYFQQFLWLAKFSRYFIDFLVEYKGEVALIDFKSSFSTYIKDLHGDLLTFKSWHEQYRSNDDFRQAVSVNCAFLYSQTQSIDPDLCQATVFSETYLLNAIEKAPGKLIDETIVTPLVYECFKYMFETVLETVVPPTTSPLPHETSRKQKMIFVEITKPKRIQRSRCGVICEPRPEVGDVKAGDVVAVYRDGVTKWKGSSELWYCFVHGRRKHKTAKQLYTITWLYHPEDTTCAEMNYPYPNELFFSDHCAHGGESIAHDDIICKASVAFFTQPNEVEKTGSEFFVRSKYRTSDSAFITLAQKDLTKCSCSLDEQKVSVYDLYKQYDTVLISSVRCQNDSEVNVLEPAVIQRIDRIKRTLLVRCLRRYNLDYPKKKRKRNARPNELVWTNKIIYLRKHQIIRKCHIKFVDEDDVLNGNIPKLYDASGAHDTYFISSYEYHNEIYAFNDTTPFPYLRMRRGFTATNPKNLDIEQNPAILRGLDIFCGGGNFGRGLEEGGAVKNVCAIDLFSAALHTYKANLHETDTGTKLYLGSVNNFLKDAILGDRANGVPMPGEIDFISAGSPCQGFSVANQRKDNSKSLQNCSLITSVASFIDVYRPKYCLLENVSEFAQTRTGPDGKKYNVFSQFLCSIVSMGYQVQQFLIDAWNHGSGQSRTRLFVSITAPGRTPQQRPPITHSHPDAIHARSILEAPNGTKIGERIFCPCPFDNLTTKDMIDDLPRVGYAHTGMCISYPDHRNYTTSSMLHRQIMSHIPYNGDERKRGYFQACEDGLMPSSLMNLYKTRVLKSASQSKCWSRLSPDKLCRTITTTLIPQCVFTGRWVHYAEPRVMTNMEARRIQNFPDDEVLVGLGPEMFKIIGNSVDRRVAQALGLSLAEAVKKNVRKLRAEKRLMHIDKKELNDKQIDEIT